LTNQLQIRADGYDVDVALNNIKRQVYKNRNRTREFFRDYDPLRHRLINDEQFAAAIDNSKVIVSVPEMRAVCDQYRMTDDPMKLVCWTAFCDEIDTVYTLKELEKTPLREVT
jgi:type III secretory pathway component EscU